MNIKSIKHSVTDLVYLKTDIQQLPRIVTGITISHNSISYQLNAGTEVSYHYDFEISTEKDVKLM